MEVRLETRSFLASVPFFADVLSAEQIDTLIDGAHRADFDRGATIIRQRDAGDSLFVVMQGSVTVSIHDAGMDRTVATLRSGDIFATAKALKANGFSPLQIPRNYYDDVEARFGLDPELADRLRAENMLYDRDGDGEYFQFYSPVLEEGFFFEIVERRGGYSGYGAPNAPFRIAAQKRHLRPEGMPRV